MINLGSLFVSSLSYIVQNEAFLYLIAAFCLFAIVSLIFRVIYG